MYLLVFHGAGGGPRQAQVMVSGSCMVWQGSGVSPAAGGENFWAFFFPSKHTFSPQNMLYITLTSVHSAVWLQEPDINRTGPLFCCRVR